jgi:hypothetical protein
MGADGGEPRRRTTIDTPSDACHRALSLRHTHGSTAFWRARIDRSGLDQISVALPVIPAILRCEVAAGWQAFVAVSGSLLAGCTPSVLPDLKCARLGSAAPAEPPDDCPSRDALVNR